MQFKGDVQIGRFISEMRSQIIGLDDVIKKWREFR